MFVCTNKVQSFVHTTSHKIGAVSPQETEPDFPVSVQESLAEARVDSGLLRGPGTEYNSACTSLFEGHHHHNYPTTVCLRQNNRERTQPCPSTESWIKNLLSMALPIRIRPSFPHSLSHQEASTSLLSLSTRGQTERKPQSQRTNQTDHMDHSLVQLNEIMSHAM